MSMRPSTAGRGGSLRPRSSCTMHCIAAAACTSIRITANIVRMTACTVGRGRTSLGFQQLGKITQRYLIERDFHRKPHVCLLWLGFTCLEGNIPLHFLLREIHLIAGGNELWHLQVICGFHGNRDVRDQSVDLFLRPWKGLVGKHHLPIALIRQEKPGTILADEPPQPPSPRAQRGWTVCKRKH